MEEELLLCMMYLFDDNEVTTFFKQKKVESMTWDLLHLRFLKERILVNKKDKILNFPLILSSDNAFNKIMEIREILSKYSPGEKINVTYESDGVLKRTIVELGESPENLKW